MSSVVLREVQLGRRRRFRAFLIRCPCHCRSAHHHMLTTQPTSKRQCPHVPAAVIDQLLRRRQQVTANEVSGVGRSTRPPARGQSPPADQQAGVKTVLGRTKRRRSPPPPSALIAPHATRPARRGRDQERGPRLSPRTHVLTRAPKQTQKHKNSSLEERTRRHQSIGCRPSEGANKTHAY